MKLIDKLIPSILIFLSAAIFAATVAFKSNAQKNYLALDNHLESLKLSADVKEHEEELRRECVPFTYFDEVTDNQLQKIFDLDEEAIVKGGGDYQTVVQNEIFEMQTLLHQREQNLIFGFDCLMYFSLILVMLAITVIIYDLSAAKSELNRVKTINEQQVKFSRDLHDGVAQDLAALKVYIEKKDDEKSNFYAEQALKEVRYLINAMHQDLNKPFNSIIEETLNDFETNYGIKTSLLIVSENINKIKTQNQIELLRILQEALSNIARHSNATKVVVQFTEVGDDLKFTIRDNGVGFEIDNLKTTGRKHYGVKNIEDRVHGLGGSVEFINQGGTTIAITIKNFVC